MILSIITINLNDQTGLEKTITSVISQSFKNYEFIIIDGKSIDDSVNIILKYKEHINYWISEKDTGIYNAMNKGISKAHGKYCLFLNSGDFLHSSTVLEELFSNRFDEDIISCGLQTFSEKEQRIKLPPRNITLYSLIHSSLSHQSTLIKREVFEKVGYYHENYKIMSDWCFFVEALILYNCTYRAFDLILSYFNCYGISSMAVETEHKESQIYLKQKFPRIIDDYFMDEYTFNTIYWLHQQNHLIKSIILFPFRIINRILHLRNKLKIRITTEKI